MSNKKRYSANDPKAQPDSNYKILNVFIDLCNNFNKNYCYPSMATIRDILKKRYNWRLGPRQIYNIICFMVESGQVKKVNRHCKGPNGELELHSNLYTPLKRGLYLLNRWRNQHTNRPLHAERNDYPKPRHLIDPLKEMFKDQDRTGTSDDEIKPISNILWSYLQRYQNQLTNQPLFEKKDDYPKPRPLIDPLKKMFKDQDKTGTGDDEIKAIGDILLAPLIPP